MALDATGKEHTEDNAQWGNIAADRLRALVDRIERLDEERKAPASNRPHAAY
jgi:uncharacterized protein (UPF0335 family)